MSAMTMAAVAVAEEFYPSSDGKPMAETDTHVSLLLELRGTLDRHFAAQPEVYVSGNILLYYVEGNPKKCISPDVFVTRGIPKGARRTYKLWLEGKPPSVVIELSSRKTWREDLHTKKALYQEMGVQEYFIFDPEYDYLSEPLLGLRLTDGVYQELQVVNERVWSEVLKLYLVDTRETLRVLNPMTGKFLLTYGEAVQESIEAKRHAAAAEVRAATAEAEAARLRAELARLKKKK